MVIKIISNISFRAVNYSSPHPISGTLDEYNRKNYGLAIRFDLHKPMDT